MQLIPIKTRAMVPPKDDLYSLLEKALPKLREEDILIITSKIISIHQGRCIKITKQTKLRDLALREADYYLTDKTKYSFLTIKHHAILSSAGVDSSNGNGYFILPPKAPQAAAKKIWQFLKKKFRLEQVGVIIADSHSIPLRHGTLGIALGFYGIEPLRDFTGQKSVFGSKLKTARSNIVDALAASGTLLMGEGGERVPLVVARGLGFVKFKAKVNKQDLFPKFEEDIYAPLLKRFKQIPFDNKRKNQ